jgi:hypothetical protein
MCPQLPRLSPEYSHKAGLHTVITGMPLQIRPVTRGGHAGPVTMGRIARGPLSWTRPRRGMPSSPVFVWCRSSEGCPCLLSLLEQRLSSGDFERRVAFLPSLQHLRVVNGGRSVVLALPRGCRGSFDLVLLVSHLGEVYCICTTGET